jgi:hypothetical protein
MSTILEEYRSAVRRSRPNARLVIVKDQEGFRWYQIVDGDEKLSSEDGNKTNAWREAEYRLANLHNAAAWA